MQDYQIYLANHVFIASRHEMIFILIQSRPKSYSNSPPQHLTLRKLSNSYSLMQNQKHIILILVIRFNQYYRPSAPIHFEYIRPYDS